MSDNKTVEEEIKVSGEELLGKVKQLIKEGNVRRIIIKDKSGKSLVEVPSPSALYSSYAKSNYSLTRTSRQKAT